jgi:isopenicillin-N epimerase
MRSTNLPSGVRPEHQESVERPIVSQGHKNTSTFISRTEEQGTRDAAAYLTVPAAIAFQQEHVGDDVRARCVATSCEACHDPCALLGTEPIAPEEMVLQMASVRLPDGAGETLERTLWEESTASRSRHAHGA